MRRKKRSPEPIYPERWQEIAKDARRLSEARAMYMSLHPGTKLVQAHKVVRDFHLNYKKQFP